MVKFKPSTPHDAGIHPFAARRAAMASLALSTLLASLGTSIANMALPTLAEAFAASFAQVQAVVVAYLAALTAAVFVAGHLGDRLGLRPMLLAGLLVFAAGSLLCGVAPSLGLLVGARVVQGIGAAFMMTLAMALMRETAASAGMGQAMGLLGTVSALGTALGPSLAGLLLPLAGWHSIFLLQVPLALLAWLLALTRLPASRPRPDAARVPWGSLGRRGLWPALAANVLVAKVMMATLVVGPFYLAKGLGLQAMQVGLVMSVGPVISIVGGVLAGRRVDAWGSRRALVYGLVLLTGGCWLLSVLPGWAGVGGYLLAVAVLTPGYQLFQAANNTAALADVPPAMRGAVSGLLGLSRNIGLILGTLLMGALFAWGAGTADIVHAAPRAVTHGLRLTFAVAGASMLVALGLAAAWPGARATMGPNRQGERECPNA